MMVIKSVIKIQCTYTETYQNVWQFEPTTGS